MAGASQPHGKMTADRTRAENADAHDLTVRRKMIREDTLAQLAMQRTRP
jgi:hypothetical protein